MSKLKSNVNQVLCPSYKLTPRSLFESPTTRPPPTGRTQEKNLYRITLALKMMSQCVMLSQELGAFRSPGAPQRRTSKWFFLMFSKSSSLITCHSIMRWPTIAIHHPLVTHLGAGSNLCQTWCRLWIRNPIRYISPLEVLHNHPH